MLLACALVACAPGPDERARAVFLQAWTQAHASRDVEAQLALYCWDGVDYSHRAFVRQSLVFESEFPLAEASIEPLEDNDGYSYVYEGSQYRPNLTPVARLRLVFDNQERLHSSLLLGVKDDRYLLVNPAPISFEK